MSEYSKRILLVTSIIVSLFPAFLLVSPPTIAGTASVSLWFAAVLGYVGITLMLWMYVLGAKSIMGLVFHDLAPVLTIHKWLGKYGTLAIFAHPLLITFGFAEFWLYSFLPNLATFYERNVTLGRISFWLLLLTWFVSALLRDRIAFRPWKYLHYLAYLCIPFALLHIPNVGSHYMSSTAVKAYFFVLVLVFALITLLRLRGLLNLDKTRYSVVSQTQLTKTDYVLRLKPLLANYVVPKRGQYVYIKLGFVSEDHPFSVLHYNETTHELTVGYRVYGNYTRLMSGLDTSQTLYVGGPYGTFLSEFKANSRPAVFISGGIGITPFVDYIKTHSETKEQWLFAANRHRSSATFVAELAPYLGTRLVAVYSRERSKLRGQEVAGHIDAVLLKKHLGDLTRYSFYLCGPPAMMAAMRKQLIANGVSPSHIENEQFGW